MKKAFSELLAWLLPDELQSDPVKRRNALRVLAIGGSALPWAPIYAFIYYCISNGTYVCTYLVLLTGASIVASLVAQRVTLTPDVGAHGLVFTAWWTFTAVGFFTGGHMSPVSVWYLVIPVITTAMSSATAAVIWSAACILAVTTLYLLPAFGVPETLAILPQSLPFLEWIGVVTALVCILSFALVSKWVERAALREAELARAEAEAASRVKGEFLATMSHEIRTPLNGVIGMLSLLTGTELSEKQRDFVRVAHNSAEALLSVINDILDFSKIEAGKIDLEVAPFDLRRTVEEVGEMFAVQAAARQLDLVVRYAPGTPRRILADPARIRQVLVNLVGNAVKFTEKGHVCIDVEDVQRANGGSVFQIAVEDTGIGMTPETISRVFDRFNQADASTTRRFGGTGLGLAISKRLIDLMGGTITVASKPGDGSTFTISLPAAFDSTPTTETVWPFSLRGLNLLVVDDNAVNRRVLAEQFDAWGLAVAQCSSGAQALEALRRAHSAGNPYHIVLMDHQMPDLDGVSTAEQIFADPALSGTAVILLTSMGYEPEGYTEANGSPRSFAGFLIKPVRPSRLFEVLADTWQRWQRQQTGVDATAGHARKPAETALAQPCHRWGARVLVAEDNPTNQHVARLALEQLGCQVEIARDGQEAIERVDAGGFDIVFMDCEMPRVDGFAATEEIRRRHPDYQTPIVAMTARAFAEDRKRCLEAGMDDFLTKPVTLDGLDRVLAKWTPHRCSQRPAQAPEPAAVASNEEVTNGAAVSGAAIASLRSMVGDEGELKELFETFLDQADGLVRSIEVSARQKAADDLRGYAHTLKGSSASLGAKQLSAVCAEIENLGRSGRPDAAGPALARLVSELARVDIVSCAVGITTLPWLAW